MAHIGSFYRDRGLSRAFLEVDFSYWRGFSFVSRLARRAIRAKAWNSAT